MTPKIDPANYHQGMCKNIVEKGDLDKPLLIYNRTFKRAEDFSKTLPSGKSKAIADIPDIVSQADIIFTCVGDDPAIKETIDTALKTNIKNKLFVDCSTVHPETTEGISQKIQAAGGTFVACPVFGAPAMADNGQLVCVLAGPASEVDKVKPYTTGVIGRAIIDYSDQPVGQALLLKVIGNSFILSMIETLSEGHVLAEKTGLGSENLHKFIETMFPGPYVAYSNRMMSGDYWKREEPLFAVDLARKDANHAMDLAKSEGARMRIMEVVDEHLEVVKEEMGKRGDIASVYGAVRKEGGLKFEN